MALYRITELRNSVTAFVKLAARSPQKRLKLLLVDRDLQLEDLARATGLSLSLTEKIATGHRRPTARTVERLETFFGTRIFSTPAQYRTRVNRERQPERISGPAVSTT
jgi:transcriptional regulator with XRE-family HTH domain